MAMLADQADRRVLELVRESGVLPFTKHSLASVPEATGVYILLGYGHEFLYVASTGPDDVLRRCLEGWFLGRCHRQITHFKWLVLGTSSDGEELADRLVRHFDPPFNRRVFPSAA